MVVSEVLRIVVIVSSACTVTEQLLTEGTSEGSTKIDDAAAHYPVCEVQFVSTALLKRVNSSLTSSFACL